MLELMTLLAVYYKCTALATDGLLTQRERFACYSPYQLVKREFLEESLQDPAVVLTIQQNTEAYLRFKAWEAANPDVVRDLKSR